MASYGDDDDDADFEDARDHDAQPALQTQQALAAITAGDPVDEAWSEQDKAILREFNHVRELQLALFSKHMALETTFRKIEPEHDFDKRSAFCEHLPEAFREKAHESEGVMTALTSVTDAMAALSASLLASEPPPTDADTDDVIYDYEVPSAADAGFEDVSFPAWTPFSPPAATAPSSANGGARSTSSTRHVAASSAAAASNAHADASRAKGVLTQSHSFIDHGVDGGSTARTATSGVRAMNGGTISPPPRPAAPPTRTIPPAPKR